MKLKLNINTILNIKTQVTKMPSLACSKNCSLQKTECECGK